MSMTIGKKHFKLLEMWLEKLIQSRWANMESMNDIGNEWKESLGCKCDVHEYVEIQKIMILVNRVKYNLSARIAIHYLILAQKIIAVRFFVAA
jgi:hypothetical protein